MLGVDNLQHFKIALLIALPTAIQEPSAKRNNGCDLGGEEEQVLLLEYSVCQTGFADKEVHQSVRSWLWKQTITFECG